MSNSTHPLLSAFQDAERGKVVSAADAVRLIRDGDTVATGGFVGIGFAEGIAVALEQRFLATQADSCPAPNSRRRPSAAPAISPSSTRQARATARTRA